MGKRILLCWLGKTDLNAAKQIPGVGLGPVAQAAQVGAYDEIVLLNNWPINSAEEYVSWLQRQASSLISLHDIPLSGPTDFGEIYQGASTIIDQKLKEHGQDTQLVFHLSPGTPAMASVWILLAKTRFPADLIESSMEHGVRAASVPFDISADFIPDLFRRSDHTIERLAAGLLVPAPEFEDIIRRSESMQRVVLMARRIAPHSIPVLIEGESGTGKELFARAIHDASTRKDKPFVVINCGAIPAELVESELFGYEQGAFTGANKSRVGHFEAADHGTLFLDEIGELPKEMQVKLLRTIQEGEVKRVGATSTRKIDVRIIAATNRNLINEVFAGTFREDLFYRLAVGVIKLPPLRERQGDVTLLIDKLLDRMNTENRNIPGYKQKIISASGRNLLLGHTWPGNVRELQNTLTRAAVWSAEGELDEEDIREALLPVSNTGNHAPDVLSLSLGDGFNLAEIMKTVAAHYLRKSLAEAHGNKSNAAKLLGLPSYQTLTNWLRKYDVE